jgi:hypothetical protein
VLPPYFAVTSRARLDTLTETDVASLKSPASGSVTETAPCQARSYGTRLSLKRFGSGWHRNRLHLRQLVRSVVDGGWGRLGAGAAIAYAALGTLSFMSKSPIVPPYPPDLARLSFYPRIAAPFHGSPTLLAAVFVLLLFSAFVVYFAALQKAALAPERIEAPVVWAIVFAALLVPTPPLASQDVYSYASYGRLQAIHNHNPYLVGPSAAPDDPSANYVGRMWWDMPSVYGPTMQVLSLVLASVASDFSALVLLLKLSAALALGISLWLLVKCARLASRSAALAVVAVGWNPLVVLHIAGGGHNDIFVATALLGAVYLHLRHRRLLATLVAVAAALVKLTALVPLGIYCLLVWRKRDAHGGPRQALLLGAFSAAVIAGAYAPFWAGISTLGALARVGGLSTTISVPAITGEIIRLGLESLGFEPLRRGQWVAIMRVIFAIGFGVYALGLLRRLGRSDELLPEVVGKVLLAFCLTTGYLLPWYLVWPLLLLSLVPTSRAFALCNAAAFVYAFTQLPGGYVLLSPSVRAIGEGLGKVTFFTAVFGVGVWLFRRAFPAPRGRALETARI